MYDVKERQADSMISLRMNEFDGEFRGGGRIQEGITEVAVDEEGQLSQLGVLFLLFFFFPFLSQW